MVTDKIYNNNFKLVLRNLHHPKQSFANTVQRLQERTFKGNKRH